MTQRTQVTVVPKPVTPAEGEPVAVATPEPKPDKAERAASHQENPYLAARREWDERYGTLLTRAKNWRLVALLCAGVNLIESPGILALALRGKQIIVVPVNQRGQTLGSIQAGRTTADEMMKRTVVSDWVSDLRTVTNDPVTQREAINRVYAKIASGTPAQVFINDFYRNDPPQTRALTHTVHVEINSVLATSDKTYEVEWQETNRDLQGQVQFQQRWKGAFTTALNPPDDEVVARLNPLGLYVTHASWSKIL